MDKAIVIFINGDMHLIENNLSVEQINNLDPLAKEFLTERPELIYCTEKEIFKEFINYVYEKFQIKLNSIDISHVFRIK